MSRRLLLVPLTFALLAAAPGQAQAQAQADRAALNRLIDGTLKDLLRQELPWGGFTDPLSGPRFGYGAIAIGWVAARRGQPEVAAPVLRTGARVQEPGGFQTWIEALAVTDSAVDEQTRAVLAAHLQAYRAPAMGENARPCFASPRCFSNLELVDAMGSLQLARTGLTSPVPGTRLADPAALERGARAFLAVEIPRAERPELKLHAASLAVSDAAVLSDGVPRPLAYHTLTTALLVRAVRMGAAPRSPARRALWASVALADPRGELSWMGRGQQHLWSVAATFYAATAGAAEFGASDPKLAARLRSLAALTLAELERRRTATGLNPGPSPRATLQGLDHSADSISCNGLALLWLQLAAEETEASGAVAPIPAHVDGAVAHDPAAAVATLRRGDIWFAVHGAATHPSDARYDAGLITALVARDGGWRAIVGQHPNTDAEPTLPAAGPRLEGHACGAAASRTSPRAAAVGPERRRACPPAGPLRVTRRAITLGPSRYRALPGAVELRTPCPAGARLHLTEWIAESDPPRITPRGVELKDRALRFSQPVRKTWLPGVRASAAHERVRGLHLTARCTGRPLTVTWSAR